MKVALERKLGSADIRQLIEESNECEPESADVLYVRDDGTMSFREWNDDLPICITKRLNQLML